MAFFAGDRGMLTLQRIACELVVEFLGRFFPMDDWKINSVMLEMAANAILAIHILHTQPCVVSAILA